MTSEQLIRDAVKALNSGRCVLGCGRPATNYAHRLPAGQGGPVTPANGLGLCGSGTTGCHGASESHRALSYACGWLLRAGSDPTRVPALIVTSLSGPSGGWHHLDADGLAHLIDPSDVPAGMWDGSLADAQNVLYGAGLAR